MLVEFSCSFLASSFDRFRSLLETSENTRGVFVLTLLRSLSTTVSPSHKRPEEILVARLPSCDLFCLSGPARMVVPFSLFPFAFLRLTVDRVSGLLILILPHRLSDVSV